MAATQMSKTFLGASIKSAVPVQGKASLATLACDARQQHSSVCQTANLSSVHRPPSRHLGLRSSPGLMVVRMQGNKQVTRAAVEFYGPERAKFLGERWALFPPRNQHSQLATSPFGFFGLFSKL